MSTPTAPAAGATPRPSRSRTTRAVGAAAAAAVLGALVLVPTVGQAGAEAPQRTSHRLTGTWQVVADPAPADGQDAPPFESTIVYGGSHDVVEATSRATSMSAGLGAWRKVAPSTYRAMFQKYRFDGTGAYLGKTVVRETIEVTGRRSYTGSAVTEVVNPAGVVVARFESDTVGTRLRP